MSKVRYCAIWMGPMTETLCVDLGIKHCAGIIQVYGGVTEKTELKVPLMLYEDFVKFREWVKAFETDDVWSAYDLFIEYEKTHDKITWYQENTP